MSIALYDASLTEKIQNWLPEKTPLKVLSPKDSSRLFKIKSDMQNDKEIKLPLIALSRDTDFELLSPHKQPLTFDGKMTDATTHYSYQLNAVPISLRYQLDIYTRYEEEGDEFMREFIFQFINNPQLKIEIPYNQVHYEHISNVMLESQVSDTSDIAQHIIPDQFTRWTIGLVITDAYLFSVPKYDILSGNLELIELNDEIEHI